MESNGTNGKIGYLDWVLSVFVARNYSNRSAGCFSQVLLYSTRLQLDNRGMLSLCLQAFEDNIATVLVPTLHEVMLTRPTPFFLNDFLRI